MEKVFEDILKTDKGKEIIFNIISVAVFYKQNSLKPHNPLVKQFGKETVSVQQIRKLLFQNLTDFEELISELYTFNEPVFPLTNDLTSEPK